MNITTLKVDNSGRITLPVKLRKKLDIKPGDTLLANSEDNERILLKKGDDPFEVLAEEAIRQYRDGKTISIEELAKEMGVDLG